MFDPMTIVSCSCLFNSLDTIFHGVAVNYFSLRRGLDRRMEGDWRENRGEMEIRMWGTGNKVEGAGDRATGKKMDGSWR